MDLAADSVVALVAEAVVAVTALVAGLLAAAVLAEAGKFSSYSSKEESNNTF